MLRLLTDARVTLDPVAVDAVPATLVLALNDALDLCDDAEAEAYRRAAPRGKGG